jgi:prolyl oligopeptidase
MQEARVGAFRQASIVATLVLSTPVMADPGPAPVFPKSDVSDLVQGTSVPDPWRALENAQDPAVQAWSDAQNARTRAYLDGLPGRAAVAARLLRMVKAESPSWHALVARGTRIFAILNDPAHQQPALVTIPAGADSAVPSPLVDPNAIDPAGHVAIDWFVPSLDGSKVAVSLSRNGSEEGTLHVYDVASGREIDQPIPRVQFPTGGGAVAWAADGSGFWYTRYPGDEAPEAERRFNEAVWFHTLGTPQAQDRQVLSAADGLPRTGEVFLENRDGGPAVLTSVQLGDGGQWLQFVLRQGQPALKIAGYEDRIIAGAIDREGTVFGLSRKDAPMGKVLKLRAPYTGGFAAAPTIIAPRQDAAIVDGGEFGLPLVIAGRRLVVQRIAGGPSAVAIYDFDGHPVSDLPLPPVSGVANLAALPDGDLLYSVHTFTRPPYFERWHAATGQATSTGLVETSPIHFDDVTVTRIFATSKDGTKVPLNVIAAKGIKLDGSHPTLLYGYGGYGVNLSPAFLGATRRLWLDAGGVFVLANIRGGGEYGDDWHRQGMLTHKQNVFDDFDAAAETLIAAGYTSHDHLALMGGSNGGLLMGATLTQHPGLARVVVSSVGIYDMVRYERDPNGAFNVTEFGTVNDPDQFRALYAYSPYHHVVPGTDYPAVLMLTGATDGRVNPMNSRKFTAALQAAQSDPAHPILLRTSKNSGHGMGSSLDERVAESTDMLMFMFDQLKMPVLTDIIQ